MGLEGGSAFVTGGSRGIGKAIALRFAELGAARVAIGYLRNDSAAEATAAELREAGAEPVLVRGNVSSERVAREVAELGPLNALVHNAATGVIRPALEIEKKHWDWTLDANSYALLALARAAAPQMPSGSTIVWPHSIFASSETRNDTEPATSSGSTSRPAGVRSTERRISSRFGKCSRASVSTTPAETALTRIPRGASSTAR